MGYALACREVPAEPYAPGATAADLDEIESLGDEIALRAAHLHSGMHELLELIARFHRLRGWEPGGHRTCAHWLHFRTGYSLGTAREYVRVALALEDLPETRSAMHRGAISFCKARAITRVAKPETEGDLLALAEDCTTAQLERVARAWRKHSRLEEEELERERLRSRRLSVSEENGMYAVRAFLPAEGGASFMRGIDEASDEVYRAERASGIPPDEDTEAAAARRRADALVLLVERGLMVGFDGSLDAEEEEKEEDEKAEDDGAMGAADSPPAISGTRAQRYQVMLLVEPGAMVVDGEPGRCELEDGTRVSYETARRIACDAGIVRVEQTPEGEILNVGRRSRTLPPAIRRAAEVRDRGCRFPGCGIRYTEGHHIHHWTDGGETSLRNSVLLCRFHHRLVHEGGWKLSKWSHGRVAFTDLRGQVHVGGEVPRMPTLPEKPVEAMIAHNRERGADPGVYTASARWKCERDIPDAIMFRAVDAVL